MPKLSTVTQYIQAKPAPLRPILRALRKLLREAAPKADETIKWDQPTYVHAGNVCYLTAMKGDYVNLGFFRGAGLPDPKGLLEGTGKGLRHVKVHCVADIKQTDLKRLVRASIKLDAE